jgi:hypothetical protein
MVSRKRKRDKKKEKKKKKKEKKKQKKRQKKRDKEREAWLLTIYGMGGKAEEVLTHRTAHRSAIRDKHTLAQRTQTHEQGEGRAAWMTQVMALNARSKTSSDSSDSSSDSPCSGEDEDDNK